MLNILCCENSAIKVNKLLEAYSIADEDVVSLCPVLAGKGVAVWYRLPNDESPADSSASPTNSAMDAILKEADILRKEHKSKDCRFFAESVYRELSRLPFAKRCKEVK